MSEFIAYLVELFEDFGEVTSRRMFGGHGLYHNGVMFGLIADDTLYLKTDESNIEHFDSRGLPPFEYKKGDKIVKMSYCLAPSEIFDDPEQAALWATRSYEAARNARYSGKGRGR